MFTSLILAVALLGQPAPASASSFLTVSVIGDVAINRIISPTIIQFAGVEDASWVTEPPRARERFVKCKIPVGTGDGGETLLTDAWRLAWHNHPQVVVLLLGDRAVLDRFVIPAEGVPTPDPFPQPDPSPIVDPPDPPDPTPDPPIVETVTEVILIWETEVTNRNDPEAVKRQLQESKIIFDQGWRNVLRDAKVPFRVRDRDQLETDLLPLLLLVKAEAKDGPAVVFLDERGVEHAACLPMPKSIKGLVKLVTEKTK